MSQNSLNECNDSTIILTNGFDQWPAEIKTDFDLFTGNCQIGEKLIHQDQHIRVWTIQLAAGKRFPFHQHNHPYFHTRHSQAQSRSYYHDGKVAERQYEIGSSTYFRNLSKGEPLIHNIQNIGNKPLIFTTNEFLTK